MPRARQHLLASLSVAPGYLGAALISIHLSASPTASSPAAGLSRASGAHAASVDLQPGQLDGLRIERVVTHSFPLEKQAVGSISFDEDPAIVQAESTLLTAAANLEVSNQELRRVRSLGEGNGIPQRELEQASANEQSNRAALRAAHAALRALGKSDIEIERMIASGTIPDGSGSRRKWAVANVAESDSVSVRPRQPVSLKVMAFPGRTFSGSVSRVYAAVDPSTHRVAVRVQVADTQNELRAGMLAEFAIRVAAATQSLAVAANCAVRETDGTTSVWVTADRRHFTRRTVTTGERASGWVQITDGVHAGELVVSDGAVFLSSLLQAPPSD